MDEVIKEERVKRPKPSQMLLRFLKKLQENHPDISREFDEGNNFKDPIAAAMWEGYQLGRREEGRYTPGTSIIAKITEQGMELSSHPKFHHKIYHAVKESQYLQKKHGGHFVVLSIASLQYVPLREMVKGNPNVEFFNGEISKMLLLVRKASEK